MSDQEDIIIEKVSEYLDGTLAAGERPDIAAKIADDAEWKRVHDELVETRKALSGMQKRHAPSAFAADVTNTIHKRSAGRFFARRTFGDRVPFGALLVIAVLLFAVVGYMMWSSQTGSMRVDPHHESSAPGSAAIVPTTP